VRISTAPSVIPLIVLFTPGQDGLEWAGTPFETVGDGQVEILYAAEAFYFDDQGILARDLLAEAGAIHLSLTEMLGGQEPDPLTIKLYPNDTEFQASVSAGALRNDLVQAWTAAEASVKLVAGQDATLEILRPALAVQLARRALLQIGVDSEWLLRGVGAYLAGRFDGGVAEQAAASSLRGLLQAQENDALYDLRAFPRGSGLPAEGVELAYAQAWDTVRYLVYTHGWQALVELLQEQGQGTGLGSAMEATIGQSVVEFQAAWAESLARAHALPEWIETANAFDGERALAQVDYLAAPAFSGRQAGSPEAVLAAEHIAGQFAAYGLLPLGDDGSYFQHFPIRYTTLLSAPRLEVGGGGAGGGPVAFVYRQDFLTLVDAAGGGGFAEGELVWVDDGSYEGMELGGRIAVRDPGTALTPDVVTAERRAAVEHGVGGLILLSRTDTRQALNSKSPLPTNAMPAGSIPVLRMTGEGSERLKELLKPLMASPVDAPPVQPLGIEARMDVLLSPSEVVQTANVLGYLPGSDPVLGQEVIVLGAHYDHVGDEPGGPVCFDETSGCEILEGGHYPGANDDASGVAVLLEIARLWRASGYQPRRSILFAAWGAQELGELGSRAYVAGPAFPLDKTTAMLQLDTVGGGGGYYLEAQGGTEREQLLLFNLQVADDWVDGRFAIRADAWESDHVPFQDAGVPTLLITWRDASEQNLPLAIADEVEVYRLGVTGRIVTLAVMALAR
jgi:hypothetical protein